MKILFIRQSLNSSRGITDRDQSLLKKLVKFLINIAASHKQKSVQIIHNIALI